MGYSISVSARSSRLKSRMVEFLVGSYHPWPDIVEDDEESLFNGPMHFGKLGIGFEYTAEGGPEREYNFAFVRWLALRIGRRRRQFRGFTFDSPAPYIIVSGESIPVLLEADWEQRPPEPYTCCVVDRFGLLTCPHPARDLAWYHIPEGSYERVSATHQGKSASEIQEALIRSGIERAKVILQYIRAEISRLDVLCGL